MQYKVVVTKMEPFNVRETVYECSNGEVYDNQYSVPKEFSVKVVSAETGEVAYTEKKVLEQTVDDLEMPKLIRAINNIE